MEGGPKCRRRQVGGSLDGVCTRLRWHGKTGKRDSSITENWADESKLTRGWDGVRRRNTGEGNEWKNTRNREGAGRLEENKKGKNTGRRANEGDVVQVWRESRLGKNSGNKAGLIFLIKDRREWKIRLVTKTGGKTEHRTKGRRRDKTQKRHKTHIQWKWNDRSIRMNSRLWLSNSNLDQTSRCSGAFSRVKWFSTVD